MYLCVCVRFIIIYIYTYIIHYYILYIYIHVIYLFHICLTYYSLNPFKEMYISLIYIYTDMRDLRLHYSPTRSSSAWWAWSQKSWSWPAPTFNARCARRPCGGVGRFAIICHYCRNILEGGGSFCATQFTFNWLVSRKLFAGTPDHVSWYVLVFQSMVSWWFMKNCSHQSISSIPVC